MSLDLDRGERVNRRRALERAYTVRIETKDYTVELKSLGDGWCSITGDTGSLEIVTDSIVLSGTEEGSGVVPFPGGLRVREGTLALWLQFECLNFLEFG